MAEKNAKFEKRPETRTVILKTERADDPFVPPVHRGIDEDRTADTQRSAGGPEDAGCETMSDRRDVGPESDRMWDGRGWDVGQRGGGRGTGCGMMLDRMGTRIGTTRHDGRLSGQEVG